ncbi:MAG: LysE family translocator [Asticcacaulis sp.]|nr:LysE family translocator [Asticcacaulis sp.]
MALMAVSPGPANLFFIRTGLGGRKSPVFAGVVGVNTATLVWFIASAFGLQILMSAFPLLFRILAVAGGLYVGWLGFTTFRHALHLNEERLDPRFVTPATRTDYLQVMRDGFMVQMLNPKVLLFFSAVLPPFLDLAIPMPRQIPVYAVTAIGMDVMAMTTYGLLAVTLSHLLTEPRNKQRFDLGAGMVLMLIAVVILVHAVTDLISPH